MGQRIPAPEDELERQIERLHADDDMARKALMERLIDLDGKARKPLLGRIIGPDLVEDGTASTALLQLLIDLANAGDKEALNGLFATAEKRQRAMVVKKLGSDRVRRHLDKSDARQECNLKLLGAFRKGEIKSVRDFFYLTAMDIRRVMLDIARKPYVRKHHTEGKKKAADDKGGVLSDKQDRDKGPPDLLIRMETLAQTEKLPKREREVFALHFFDELTLEDTAKLLGVPYITAKRLWYRAKELLHGMVDHDKQ